MKTQLTKLRRLVSSRPYPSGSFLPELEEQVLSPWCLGCGLSQGVMGDLGTVWTGKPGAARWVFFTVARFSSLTTVPFFFISLRRWPVISPPFPIVVVSSRPDLSCDWNKIDSPEGRAQLHFLSNLTFFHAYAIPAVQSPRILQNRFITFRFFIIMVSYLKNNYYGP